MARTATLKAQTLHQDGPQAGKFFVLEGLDRFGGQPAHRLAGRLDQAQPFTEEQIRVLFERLAGDFEHQLAPRIGFGTKIVDRHVSTINISQPEKSECYFKILMRFLQR